jgi:hypothetical protein
MLKGSFFSDAGQLVIPQKKTHSKLSGFCEKQKNTALSIPSFGGFERIDFSLGFFPGCKRDMGGHIAMPMLPFGCGIWTGGAIPARREFLAAGAAIAGLNGYQASTFIERTPLGGHKRAIDTFTNRCAFH